MLNNTVLLGLLASASAALELKAAADASSALELKAAVDASSALELTAAVDASSELSLFGQDNRDPQTRARDELEDLIDRVELS